MGNLQNGEGAWVDTNVRIKTRRGKERGRARERNRLRERINVMTKIRLSWPHPEVVSCCSLFGYVALLRLKKKKDTLDISSLPTGQNPTE